MGVPPGAVELIRAGGTEIVDQETALTAAQMLQEQMTKCTNEQFWVTGALAAFYTAIISAAEPLGKAEMQIPTAILVGVSALFGTYYNWTRHCSYFSLKAQAIQLLAPFLENKKNTPDFLRFTRAPRDPRSWDGLALYCVLFMLLAVIAVTVLLRQ